MNRRHFLGQAALAGAGSTSLPSHRAEAALVTAVVGDSRASWVAMLRRVAEPVLGHLAADRLKAAMPVEARPGQEEKRRGVTHLEALGRTLAGIAPWLAVQGITAEEEGQRGRMAGLARGALARAVDPAAADRLEFTAAPQNLVDAAFLALGLSRARRVLWDQLEGNVRDRLVAALQSTRKFTPGDNNWLLFSAVIEAFLASIGAAWLPGPVEKALSSHEEWYQGDGAYGDGPHFHWDYYNSFVIQPMLLGVLDLLTPVDPRWRTHQAAVRKRAVRYAAVQERSIATDGSYPPLGRSLTYRCGAFHHLAAMALRGELPEGVAPAQVRGALGAVIQRTLGAADTFDAAGWLRIGLAGHQPALAESYISTGSLYLCTLAFLPLGLPPAEAFWSGPAADWTSRQIWSGANVPADHAV